MDPLIQTILSGSNVYQPKPPYEVPSFSFGGGYGGYGGPLFHSGGIPIEAHSCGHGNGYKGYGFGQTRGRGEGGGSDILPATIFTTIESPITVAWTP